MRGVFLAFLMVLMAVASAADAQQGREPLGWGRMLTNDLIGDGSDRWRSGSYTMSHLRGYGWNGDLPSGFGQLLEFRGRVEVITPRNLRNPSPTDRPYAGTLSFGLHTHFERNQIEMSTGVDLVLTGPQTNLIELTDGFHRIIGAPRPREPINEIDNGVYPTLVFEAGREINSAGVMVRPFVEAQLGVESFVRVGSDLSFGTLDNVFFLRDPTSGQRYRGILGGAYGGEITFGADLAYVADSYLLPSSDGYRVEEARGRVRAGLRFVGDGREIFYGITWLSKEFEEQPESQLVGSVNVNFRF